MFSFIAGILVGSISVIFVMGLTNSGRYTEDDIRGLNASVDNWKRTAAMFETALTRRNDELLAAVRTAQYWRARCMNEHLDMKIACDGEGNYPTNEDDITPAEQNTNAILKAVDLGDGSETEIHGEVISA